MISGERWMSCDWKEVRVMGWVALNVPVSLSYNLHNRKVVPVAAWFSDFNKFVELWVSGVIRV